MQLGGSANHMIVDRGQYGGITLIESCKNQILKGCSRAEGLGIPTSCEELWEFLNPFPWDLVSKSGSLGMTDPRAINLTSAL